MAVGKKNMVNVLEMVQLALSLAMAVGVASFARPCETGEGSGFMSCHWAGQAVLGVGVVLSVVCVARLVLPAPGVRLGLSLATVPLGLLAASIPGGLIELCLMSTMRCQAIMRPAVMALGVSVAALGVADALRLRPAAAEGAKLT